MIRPDNKTKLFISVAAKPGNFGSNLYRFMFERYGINAVYIPRKAPTSPQALFTALKTLSIDGCSVSMPLKSSVIPFLDKLDEVAEMCNSVNTIVNRDENFVGYNTDFFGVTSVLEQARPKSITIYGAGSVVGTIASAARCLGINELFITCRSLNSGKDLCQRFNLNSPLTIEEASRMKVDLLINATPASNEPDTHEVFSLLTTADRVFDLVVARHDTNFIARAKQTNKQTFTGVDMCRVQLQHQFRLYTGVDAKTSDIDEALSNYFQSSS